MKKTVCALIVALAATLAAHAEGAPSAAEIVQSARDRISVNTTSTRARMVIAAKDGTTTERVVDQYSSDVDAAGKKVGDRAIIAFQKPASVAGTRFLTIDNADGGEDRWIFLPALGKVRRISSGEGSGSFVGTDFSYDDMSALSRDAAEDDHRILKEEALDGKDCWVIESVPKDASYQYSKAIQWIAKDTKMVWRLEAYDRKGALAKVLEILKAETVQGNLTPMVTKMSTVADKTSTTIYIDIIKYDEKIPDGVFTVNYLSTGRVK
jgi:hypothetical protein